MLGSMFVADSSEVSMQKNCGLLTAVIILCFGQAVLEGVWTCTLVHWVCSSAFSQPHVRTPSIFVFDIGDNSSWELTSLPFIPCELKSNRNVPRMSTMVVVLESTIAPAYNFRRDAHASSARGSRERDQLSGRVPIILSPLLLFFFRCFAPPVGVTLTAVLS